MVQENASWIKLRYIDYFWLYFSLLSNDKKKLLGEFLQKNFTKNNLLLNWCLMVKTYKPTYFVLVRLFWIRICVLFITLQYFLKNYLYMFIFKKFHFIYFQNFNYFELRQKYKRYLFIYSISSLCFSSNICSKFI